MEAVIEVEGLRKAYGTTVAVDGVDLTVERGEIFGIVGPNGAGKTTLVEIVEGLRRPDEGSVRVLGLDPWRQGRELRERIGVQLQSAALPERLKVWEALDEFASYYRRARDWRSLLAEWGLEEKRNAAFGELSGGQQQRVFIALAMVNDPELVVLDELTTGLDPQARHATWDHIRAIRERGTTVVLVTHFMEEAERLCDRVAVVDRGRVVATDTPGGLIATLGTGQRVVFSADGVDPAWLRDLPGVREVVREGGEIAVTGDGPVLARVAAAIAERGLTPSNLRSEQSTLEDVFLARTGRSVRN